MSRYLGYGFSSHCLVRTSVDAPSDSPSLNGTSMSLLMGHKFRLSIYLRYVVELMTFDRVFMLAFHSFSDI